MKRHRADTNEESISVNEMIQEIALIEYQNSEVIQKCREIEHRIKAIRFRYIKKCGSLPFPEKDLRIRVNQVKRQFNQGRNTDNPEK